MSFKQWRFQHLVIESIAFMLFGSFLVSRLSAEDQQPFPNTTFGLHVLYSSKIGRALPEGDIALKVGGEVKGVQNYSYTLVQVTGVKNNPFQLQTEVLTGMAGVKQLGEYVYFGGQGGVGVAMDSRRSVGLGGKFAGVAGYRFGKSQHWAAEGIVGADYSSLNQNPAVGKQSQLAFTAALGVRYGFNRK